LIKVPEQFAADTIAREGAAGREWIEALPSTIADLCKNWGLDVLGEPMHGYLGIVVPALRREEPCVLKVSWIYEGNEHEALALSVWDGDGAVRLLQYDEERGALLLERLDESVTLGSLAMGVSGPPPIRDIALRWQSEFKDRWQRFDGELPQRTIEAAVDACLQLGPSSAGHLVNEDLHYDNVLRGAREPWLVIDPKPVVGDLEFAVAPLLWSRLDLADGTKEVGRRLDVLVDVASLDASRAAGWALARAVDFRLWGLSLGFTEGAERCALIAASLLG
jgi:streptomycin 6-kinase